MYTKSYSHSASIIFIADARIHALRFSHSRTYSDALIHRLTRTQTHSLALKHKQTPSHSDPVYQDSFVLTYIPTDSYVELSPLKLTQTLPQSYSDSHALRFTHSQTCSHSDAPIHRLTRTQTHSLALHHKLTPSNSDSHSHSN